MDLQAIWKKDVLSGVVGLLAPQVAWGIIIRIDVIQRL